MKRQLQAIGLAAAIAATAGFASAQTGTTGQNQGSTSGTAASPTSPPAHPTQPPGTAAGTTPSPSTPPTHPTERTTPSTRPATQDSPEGMNRRGRNAGGASAEAMQVCKNLSGQQEREECMDRARRAGETAGTSGKSETDPGPNPSGTSAGKWSEKGNAPSR